MSNRAASSLVLLLSTLLVHFARTGGTAISGPLKYPLPGATFKLLVEKIGFDEDTFAPELEKITAMHVSANLMSQLPPSGQLGKDSYNEVEFRCAFLSVEPWNKTQTVDPRLSAQAYCQGYAVFQKHQQAPPTDSVYVRSAMDNLLKMSFGGEQYGMLIARYQASDILKIVKGAYITLDEPLPEGPGDDPNNGGAGNFNEGNPEEPPPSGGGGSGGGAPTVLIVILVLVAVVCVAFILYVVWWRPRRRRRKDRFKKNKRKPKTLDDDDGHETDPMQTDDEESFPGHHGDGWMDEWAEKITSIPLKTTKPRKQRHPVPRPAHRSKGNMQLQAIVEESERSESAGEDFEGGNYDSVGSVLGPTLEEGEGEADDAFFLKFNQNGIQEEEVHFGSDYEDDEGTFEMNSSSLIV